MIFEWDEEKNRINQKRHDGISFEMATHIFADPNLLIVPDPNVNEDRWNAIGLVEKVLFAVYTERDNDTIRIISARKATKEEINGYKNHDFRRS